MNHRRIALFVALTLAFQPQLHAHDEAPAEIAESECGKAALAMLLMIEGKAVRAGGLDALLAAPPDGGYSMLELQRAARACGMEVDPIELGRAGVEIDRPMLALLGGPSSNHYVLTRPIPGRRSMVQIVDPRGFSSIVRQDELTSSAVWTGFVLRPGRASLLGSWGEEAAIGTAVAGAPYAAGAALSKRSSRHRA